VFILVEGVQSFNGYANDTCDGMMMTNR